MKLECKYAALETNKEQMANKCVDVANKAKFSTDYNDVYNHLFFGEDLLIVYAYENEKLIGFASLIYLKENKHYHINGVIVDPDYQGMGIANKMVSRAVGFTQGVIYGGLNTQEPLNLSARTQNPAIYALIHKICEKTIPDQFGKINREVRAMLKSNQVLKPFLGQFNNKMITVKAYPSAKVKVKVKNENINKLFEIGKLDARIVYGKNIKNIDFEQLEMGLKEGKSFKETKNNQQSTLDL